MCTQNVSSHNQSFYSPYPHNYSMMGMGGLVHHRNGTVEVIPKSREYVLGERILGPTIASGMTLFRKAINIARTSLNFVDARVSSLFAILPVASAQGVIVRVEQNPKQEDRRDVIITRSGPSACQMDFVTYTNRLSIGERNNLFNDNAFSKVNYDAALLIKIDLETYVEKLAENVKSYAASLLEYTDSYKHIDIALNSILSNLQNEGVDSDYSPFKKGILVVTFPTCIINPPLPGGEHAITVKKGDITFNGKSLIGQKATQPNSLLGEMQLEEKVWNKIFENPGLDLDFFYVDCSTTLPDFIQLFTNGRIQGMSNKLNKKKIEVEAWLQKRGTFLNDFVNEKNNKIGGNIQKRIESFFREQKILIDDSNEKKNYKIEKNIGQYLEEWKVIWSNWSTEEIFHFSTKKRAKVKDNNEF